MKQAKPLAASPPTTSPSSLDSKTKVSAERFSALLNGLSKPELRQLLAREHPSYADDWWEVPAPIDEFVKDPAYLNMDGQVWESVLHELREIFRQEDGRLIYTEAALVKAIGAGKSFTSSIFFAYLAYRTLCLKSPQKYYKLAAGSKIAFINLAPSAAKARDVVFNEVQARVGYSPWFRTYYPPDPRVTTKLVFDHVLEDEKGKPLEAYKGQKNLAIIPGNSSRNMAIGYNVLGGIIDEAAFFETMQNIGKGTTERTDALYDAVQSRIFSRFGEGAGLLMMISSPQYADDFIEKKAAEARVNPRIYSNRQALWEAKPEGTYSEETFEHEVEVGEQKIVLHIPIDFQDKFIRNPQKSERDLAAVPSLALNPFMDKVAVDRVVAHSLRRHPVKRETPMGFPLEFEPWFKDEGFACAVHIDLAKSRDACGFCMGWWDYKAGRAVFPLILQLRTSKRNQLDYEKVRGLVITLRQRGFSIRRVSYDNFQSVDSVQLLTKAGFEVEELSVDRSLEPYDTLQSFTNTGDADYYKHDVLVRELKRLELVNGVKVDHPPHGSKDVADAVAGVAYWLGQFRAEYQKPGHRIKISNRGPRSRPYS